MKKIFAANWKLYKSPNDARLFFTQFKQAVKKTTGELVFFPSAVSADVTAQSLQGSAMKWGAQNCYVHAQGAYTGENSAQMIKEMGGTYVLVGHSERRQIFGETDALICDKVSFVQGLGLTPMLCVGETLAEREAAHTFRVLETQLELALAKADKEKPLVVAYEPVWAIGTGKVATPEQVAEAHTDIFNILKERGFEQVPILYGGSVKPENAAGLIRQPHVNGFLVGGASLDPQSFIEIASV